MGESFYAIDPQYNEKRVESNAQAAGALAAGAKYRNVAVSGQTMNYVATTEWPAATKGGTVKVTVKDRYFVFGLASVSDPQVEEMTLGAVAVKTGRNATGAAASVSPSGR